jgi:predicted nucleotidyltransferase
MNDSFKLYSLKIFDELNQNVIKQFESLESKEIETCLNQVMKTEEMFNEMEFKLDSSINKIISLKISKEINNELNFIN